tara:strand:+ start:17379 stop:18332 length:954 start_codon:yes stop_codon:yes gene_type:complete
MIQYTYEKINYIKSQKEFSVDKDISDIISELEKLLGLDNIPEKVQLTRSERSFDRKKRRGNKMSKGSSYNDLNIEDWEAIRNFKPTAKIELSDFDKKIHEIRSDLNKFTADKFHEIKNRVIPKIIEILNENEGDSEKQQKIGNTIFDICSNDRFLSELYSEFYVELVGHFDLFGDILDNYITRFKESLSNIKYVNPDDDYEGFCDYNKSNEYRKAHSIFLVNLTKQDMISKQSLINLILFLQNLTKDYIDSENKTHEVDEITENVFLLVQNSRDFLHSCEEWENKIKQNIVYFSGLKAKEHISLSSRSVFKYMDMNI